MVERVSEQVKYADLYDFYLTFWWQMADFLVAKRFVLRYYAERFRIVGHMAELVDALVSGTSGSNTLEVRVFLCPPYRVLGL